MKVIVFGATGGLGQAVWRAGVDAGHSVTAFVRTPSKLDAADPRHAQLTVVQGDVMDAAAVGAAAAGCEIAVNCTSPAGGNSALEMAQSIVGASAAAGVKAFYMVGGMGALWAPGTGRSVLIQDWDDAEAMAALGLRSAIPRELVRQMTRGHLASMAHLQSTGLPHTYLCPGRMLDRPPSPTRVVTLDELGGYGAGEIALADVAEVIVEDLGRGGLLGHRVCVAPR